MLAMAVTRAKCTVIGVHHDDHVRARSQGLSIAGLLIAAIAVVPVVLTRIAARGAGHFNRPVGALIIHQDADIDQFRQFPTVAARVFSAL